MSVAESVSGHRDFRRLWAGATISQAGTAVGGTALPIVAVSVLHASTFEVALLATLAAASVAVLALPAGAWVEFRPKRPVMIWCDVVRVVALSSVPVAYVLHGLTFTQLCVVGVIGAVGQLVFAAASSAHLVALVGRSQLADANGRQQASTWLSLTVGPSLGGVLVEAVTAVWAVLIDGVTYLASALAVLTIRTPEPARPVRTEEGFPADLGAGFRFVRGRADLRRLLASWVLYAGCAGMSTPLTSVFYLRELHFRPWQFGLIMGLPSLAGFAGSRLTRIVVSRWGALPVVRAAALLRVPGFVVITLAVRGGAGVAMCCAGFAAMLFFSSMSNSASTSHRQLTTPDGLLVRVATLWTFSTAVAQPVFVIIGGVVATTVGVRAALVAAAVGMAASVVLLPRRVPRNAMADGVSASGGRGIRTHDDASAP